MDRLPLAVQLVLLELARLAAPLVTLVYRGGWFNTPDDPASPHGQYEPKMRGIYARWGARVNDWWWLGVRNRAYGLAYAMKPRELKARVTYDGLTFHRWCDGASRFTIVGEVTECAIDCGWFHVLIGRRVTPIYNEIQENRRRAEAGEPLIPYRPVNMDGRPILSLRIGRPD